MRSVDGPLLTWLSQWRQYPSVAEPGFHHKVEYIADHPEPIDCLTLYDERHELIAILNHYPDGFPGWEEPRAINLWVEPRHQRQGIGQRMLAEFERRFGPIDWNAQRVSPAGRRLVERYRSTLDTSRSGS